MNADSFSKLLFSLKISGNASTFYKLLSNSKKFKRHKRDGTIDLNDVSADKYLLNGSQGKFEIKMRTFKGDLSIFNEIFWRETYRIPEKYVKNPEVIIDLGAHIGFTSLYFSRKYPNAKIYALEASKQNFSLLEQNLKPFPPITLIQKAIHTQDGFILFDDSGLSYNTKISDRGDEVEAVSVHTLLNHYGIDKVDLMKIDIEGAEKDILGENNEWLAKTENIIIELHKPYGLENLKNDLEPFGFRIIKPDPTNGFQNIFATRLKSQ